MPATKSSCPITREQFRQNAESLRLALDGDSVGDAEPKEFSTGSLGWYFGGKTTVEIDGVRVQVQVGVNLTIIGSKELPE